jgi:3'-phosphoadenosine 5'-phosphosulfate sulfotransferase (PAPS reductase)/FAD synthetase
MKKTITTILMLISIITLSQAQLNTDAELIKSKAPKIYDGIKCKAVNKWGNDNSMIVYSINKQSTAALDLAELTGVDDSVFTDAYIKWEDKSCSTYDYSMVMYTIKKHIKNSDY